MFCLNNYHRIKFLKTVVGFAFTENPLQRLMAGGFTFQCNERLAYGYREFICPLSAQLGSGLSIEIREIIDEVAYFKIQAEIRNGNEKIFSPFINENSELINEIQHPNSIYFVESVLGEEMQEGELKDYLKIRKQYPIWALWLKCHDLEIFNKQVKPDKYFYWQNHNAALIHLGQSCFDLIVTSA